VTRTGISSFAADGDAHRRVLTVGAALKCVIGSDFKSDHITG
jgi:hypothetical protein